MVLTAQQRRLLEAEDPDDGAAEVLDAPAPPSASRRVLSFRTKVVVVALLVAAAGGVITSVLLTRTKAKSSPPASPPPASPPPPSPPSFNSKNISVTEWLCTYANASTRLDVSFAQSGGPPVVTCGFPEVLQNASTAGVNAADGFAPTFTFASADDSKLYTLLVADRDAQSAANPWQAPVKHYADGNLPASALRAGYGAGGTSALWFNYAGPRPPAWSGCHRYYAMLYEQAGELSAASLPDTGRTNWDFVSFASAAGLRKVAVNFWMSQDLSNRTQPCA